LAVLTGIPHSIEIIKGYELDSMIWVDEHGDIYEIELEGI
jgi:hypothetical protein